jgi:hypothetical protein
MESYIRNTPKNDILNTPHKHAWNIVLRIIQFTQSELLSVRQYCEIKDIIRFQNSATQSFLITHFSKDIDESLDVDWNDVKNYCINRV